MVSCACQTAYTQVLIDTWWNVNFFRYFAAIFQSVVLIDTWWNVNVPTGDADLKRIQVLIDTWWNVNYVVRYDALGLI